MLLHIPHVLDAEKRSECRASLESAAWADGRMTAGHLSSGVKDNVRLPENDPVARRLGKLILDALDANQLFISAALPQGRAAASQPLSKWTILWRSH